MNWLSRIFNKAKNKSIGLFRVSTSNGFENIFDIANLNSFKDSLYLFIAVSMIRETVSSIPLELYKIKNNKGEVEEITDDPLLSLMERPNYRQTQKEFWKISVAYYLLAGETFWYLEKTTNNAIPNSMVNLRPDHVQILLSEDSKEIVGYEFNVNGNTIKLRADDVLHIKNIDPLNPIRGIGVVRPATQRILTEKEASKYQAETFRSQGRPDVAIFTNVDGLTEEATQEARRKWQKIYGSADGSKAGFFGNEVKDLKVLNASPREMDFINSQNFLRDDILAAFRIPKAMITSDDVNLANSKTARVNYYKEACMPVLDAFLDIINNKFLVDKQEDKFFRYESPVKEDRELILSEAVQLKKAGIISPNEARELMNYPSVEGKDDLIESQSPFQLSMKLMELRKEALKHLKRRIVLSRKFKAIEAITDMLEKEKGIKREQNPVFYTKELKEKYLKAWNDKVDNKSLSFKDHIDLYNDGFHKRIVKYMKDFGVNPEKFFDLTTEIREAKAIFNPLMKDMFNKTGQDIMDSIANGFVNKASENFYTPESMLQELEHRAEFFIISMLTTDFEQLKTLIIAGMADGKGINEIARTLRGYFDDMSVARAKTIARTETGRLMSQATNEAYNQSEFVTGKEWLTAKDNRVRDIEGTVNDHVHNEGVVVNPNGTFPNGEQFPAQLTINCRCALAPTV